MLELLKAEGFEWSEEANDEITSELLWSNCIGELDRDTHRWYIVVEKVVKIQDRYFQIYDYEITGDGCMYDMDLHYEDLRELVELYPYEKTVTHYSADTKYKLIGKVQKTAKDF